MPSRHELQTRRAMMWAIDNVWQLELFAKPLSNDALCSMVLVLDIRTGMDEKVPDAMAVIEKGKPVLLKDLLDELDRMQYPKRWARPQVEQICNNVRGFKGEKGLFMILATGDDPQRCGNMPEFNHTLWTAPMSSIVQMRATAAESIAETRRPPRAQSSSASRQASAPAATDPEGSEPLPSISKCMVCHKSASQRCGACRTVAYCCPEHQREHWKSVHKQTCKMRQEMCRLAAGAMTYNDPASWVSSIKESDVEIELTRLQQGRTTFLHDCMANFIYFRCKDLVDIGDRMRCFSSIQSVGDSPCPPDSPRTKAEKGLARSRRFFVELHLQDQEPPNSEAGLKNAYLYDDSDCRSFKAAGAMPSTTERVMEYLARIDPAVEFLVHLIIDPDEGCPSQNAIMTLRFDGRNDVPEPPRAVLWPWKPNAVKEGSPSAPAGTSEQQQPTEGRVCKACKESKPQDAFSANQWRGKASKRRCLACQHESKPIEVEDEDLENRLQMIALEEKRRVEEAQRIELELARRNAMEHTDDDCPICLEPIDCAERCVLPCDTRHWLCKPCLRKSIAHKQAHLDQHGSPSPQAFECPQCRAKTPSELILYGLLGGSV